MLDAGNVAGSRDLSAMFHKYSLEWTQEQMRWFVDDTLLHVQDLDMNFYLSGGAPQDDRVDFNTSNPYTANGQPWDKRFQVRTDSRYAHEAHCRAMC